MKIIKVQDPATEDTTVYNFKQFTVSTEVFYACLAFSALITAIFMIERVVRAIQANRKPVRRKKKE